MPVHRIHTFFSWDCGPYALSLCGLSMAKIPSVISIGCRARSVPRRIGTCSKDGADDLFDCQPSGRIRLPLFLKTGMGPLVSALSIRYLRDDPDSRSGEEPKHGRADCPTRAIRGVRN